MLSRASQIIWWPGLSKDISMTREKCHRCNVEAPSLPRDPPHKKSDPDYPFQFLSADYFEIKGNHYLVTVDRYSNWPIVYWCKTPDAKELVKVFRKIFETYGICDELCTDGGRQFMSTEFQTFLAKWGVRHHQTSSYHPHSNLRAESGVKSVKKIVSENCDRNGNLDTDKFSLAIMQYRNTPCRFLDQSPAQILFSRNLKDGLPHPPESLRLRPEWIKTSYQREQALARKHLASTEFWSRSSKDHGVIPIGSSVAIQNFVGTCKLKWDLPGTVVEQTGPDYYFIKMDGSGRLSKRKRQHLKIIVPFLGSQPGKTVPEVCENDPIRYSKRILEKSKGGGGDRGL